MEWKTEYLMNLIRAANSDGVEDNLEFLALLEIEKNIRAQIDEYLAARSMTKSAEPLHQQTNPLLARRQLLDLYTVALMDSKLSASEKNLIDEYIKASEIPEHVAEDIRGQAEDRVTWLLSTILDGGPT